jgi:uncharacterized protein
MRDGLRLAVRLSPRAKADRLGAVGADADGGLMVAAAVRAPPVDGCANEALLRLTSRTWRLPRRDLSIVSGAASRWKIVRIAGDLQELRGRLAGRVVSSPDR